MLYSDTRISESGCSKIPSPENQEASKVRQSGAKFRIVAIQGLPLVK